MKIRTVVLTTFMLKHSAAEQPGTTSKWFEAVITFTKAAFKIKEHIMKWNYKTA